MLTCDRSEALTRIASKHNPHSTVVADNLSLPHPLASFDFAISIAVVHHLSTPSRRVLAIKAILETIKPCKEADKDGVHSGKALIYVWALEQKNSRRGWDKGDDQDVMVPWVMKEKPGSREDKTFHRYYHLYHSGELESDIVAAGGHVIESGYEKDNWWAIAVVKTT